MKIYSWNMYYRNPDLDRALSFIRAIDFDVLCLQEVPEPFLERLKTLPFEMVFGRELDFVDKSVENAYCVILSKHPVLRHEDFALRDFVQPLRTKAFVKALHPFGWRRATNRRSLLADINMPERGPVRVFCLHLTLSHPSQRSAEMDLAMQRREASIPNIVCGDLNILEWPHITVLNWILGGRLRDMFAWRSERRSMEKKFSKLELQNPLRGRCTQTVSCSQLDHIIVPKSMSVVQAYVIQDRYGSDHHPVFVECA